MSRWYFMRAYTFMEMLLSNINWQDGCSEQTPKHSQQHYQQYSPKHGVWFVATIQCFTWQSCDQRIWGNCSCGKCWARIVVEGVQWLQKVHQARGCNLCIWETHAREMVYQSRSRIDIGDSKARCDATDKVEASTGSHCATSIGRIKRQSCICNWTSICQFG